MDGCGRQYSIQKNKMEKIIKPRAFMFILTMILGMIIPIASVGLIVYAFILERYWYILLAIIAFVLCVLDYLKMLKYKITFTDTEMLVEEQKFSYNFWQTDKQNIIISNIVDFERDLINLHLILDNRKKVRIWVLPFSQKQIKLILQEIQTRGGLQGIDISVDTKKKQAKNTNNKRETNTETEATETEQIQTDDSNEQK